MGLFDTVNSFRNDLVCSEGHHVTGFQTKDLGETMGYWTLGDVLTGTDGGYGYPEARPFTGVIQIYTACEECPAFLQANTYNLCPCSVEFDVTLVEDRVTEVRRTSPSTKEWLETEPKEKWMAGCEGPMPYAAAQERQFQARYRGQS